MSTLAEELPTVMIIFLEFQDLGFTDVFEIKLFDVKFS